MPAPRPDLDRSRDASFGALFAALLLAALLLDYGLMIVAVGTTGPRFARPGLLIGLSSLTLVAGLAGHLALAWSRGHLSSMWPGLLFPLVFSAFHFGSLGTTPPRGWYEPSLFPAAWVLATVCLLGWMVGHSIARGKPRFESEPRGHMQGRVLTDGEYRLLAALGGILFATGFFLLLALYVQLGGVRALVSADYGDIRAMMDVSGGAVGYLLAFARMMCLVGLTVHVTASGLGVRRVFRSKLVLVLVLAHLALLFFQGDRSELSGVLFPIVMARHFLVRPIEWRRAAVAGVIALMVFAGLKTYRGTKRSADFVASATDSEQLTYLTDEMGWTIDVVVRCIEVVPDKQPYFAGRTYAQAAGRVVPNVVLPRTPDAIVSSDWITRLTNPDATVRKGGLGFSIVAEAFINFGFLGAPVVLMLIGALHGWMERWLATSWIAYGRLCLFCLLETGLLFHVRNTVVLYVRLGAWMAIMLLAVLAVLWLMRRLRLWFRPFRGVDACLPRPRS